MELCRNQTNQKTYKTNKNPKNENKLYKKLTIRNHKNIKNHHLKTHFEHHTHLRNTT